MDYEEKLFNALCTIALSVGTAIAVFVLCWLFSIKRVDGYYLGTPMDTQLSCVYAHWTWNADQRVFCTPDHNEALQFITKLNASIK